MKRFITEQQHVKSCGPVAIMNARKWLGESVVYREEINKFKKLGWNPDGGVYQRDIHRMLKHFGIKYKLHKKPTVELMKKILKRDNAMVFCYDWISPADTGGHVIFIDFHAIGHFNAYNYQSGFETGMVCEEFIKQAIYSSRMLRKNNRKGRKAAQVWEIIK